MDKKKVLKVLEEERERMEDERLEEHNIIIELKKLEESYGMIKGFIYKKDGEQWKLTFRGSILMPINPSEERWKDLNVGESKYIGITFDTESKTLGELVKDFLTRSLKEGKMQDFVPKIG